MTKRVPYHIVRAHNKKFMIDKNLEETDIIFFEKFFYVRNLLPQACSHKICPQRSITISADASTNRKTKTFPFFNGIFTDGMMVDVCYDITTNHYSNFWAFFKAIQRNLPWKFNGNNMSSINSKKPQQYLFQFKKANGFLNLNFCKLSSKILQEMNGESKKELEESWGGPEAFKLILFLNDDFNDVAKKSPSILVFFSAGWCAHCRQLRKPFGKAALMAKEANLPISFATMDVNLNPDIADANDVVGIPTLKYYRNGVFISNYKGKRTAEDIFEFVKNPPQKATSKESVEL